MDDGSPREETDLHQGGDSSVTSVEQSGVAGESTDAGESGSRSDDDTGSAANRPVDFERFGPADMERMTRAEWEAAFDSDTWITGSDLVDRVERDLKSRIGARDVFAELRRLTGGRLLAYSDEGYAILYPNGSVEGEGSVLDDMTSSVVLCAMDDYEVPPVPDDWSLPTPEAVSEGTGELGNLMLLVVGGSLLLAGAFMLAGTIFGVAGRAPILLVFSGLAFVVGGLFMLVIVANARLSARFRVAEYRERLRAVGAGSSARPAFVPVDDDEIVRPSERRSNGVEGDRPEPGRSG